MKPMLELRWLTNANPEGYLNYRLSLLDTNQDVQNFSLYSMRPDGAANK
jgi:hypothetical protein